MIENNLLEIISKFIVVDNKVSITQIDSGHINDTYLIKTADLAHTGYVLQKINHKIFRNIEGLMNNIISITDHIKTKLIENNSEDIGRKVLMFNESSEGKYYYQDQAGNFWRCCKYIENSVTYDKIENESIAYKGGTIIGEFMNYLSDFEANNLVETIPKFHDLEWRWENFESAISHNSANLVQAVNSEINKAKEKYRELVHITKMLKSGLLPLRVTHNDTKFNNILFSEYNEALCLIDLDTVMPGSLLHDFGDAIRTSCNTANEDEKDLSKISLNLKNFRFFTQGFIEATSGFIAVSEKNLLVNSTKFMTFIMGLRFLTDYLDGDIYYKTDYPDHNLVRCRAQFKLLDSIEENHEFMEQIVKDAFEK